MSNMDSEIASEIKSLRRRLNNLEVKIKMPQIRTVKPTKDEVKEIKDHLREKRMGIGDYVTLEEFKKRLKKMKRQY